MICAPRREPLELECASPEVAKPLSASPSEVCLRRLKLPSLSFAHLEHSCPFTALQRVCTSPRP